MKAAGIALSALTCTALTLFAAGATFAADVPRVPAVNAKPEAHLPGKFIWFDCVTDPAIAARYVEARGGKVVVAPTPFAGRGTHALFRDDTGALFGVLKSDTGDPPDRPVAAGEFLWVDLFTRDPAKAAEFYRGLAAFEVSVKGAPPEIVRHVLATGGVARASLIALPKDAADPGWLPFVQVDDVAATVRTATALGGTILLAPRPDLLNGHVAVIADPHGGILGVVNRAEAAKKGGAK